MKWGRSTTFFGEMTLDTANRPEGRFDAEIADFEGLPMRWCATGWCANAKRVALAGLVLVSQLQGSEPGRVRVPISMTGGKLYLGPLAVAQLSPLY